MILRIKPLTDCLLYAFVDTAYLGARHPGEVAAQLCQGGADLIQLRAKNAAPDDLRRLAEAILPVTRQAGIGLVINDHLAVAIEVGAEFCHLGQEDFFDRGYSRASDLPMGGGQTRIGLSTHAPAQAGRAVAAGADYIAVGPVYPTGTKPTARPVTLEYVGWAAANVTVPWFAIGGINLDNLEAVLAAGARRVCVVSAILLAPDIVAACRAFKRQLKALT
jgi:thiamine-phosphate pyrophosphorylase